MRSWSVVIGLVLLLTLLTSVLLMLRSLIPVGGRHPQVDFKIPAGSGQGSEMVWEMRVTPSATLQERAAARGTVCHDLLVVTECVLLS